MTDDIQRDGNITELDSRTTLGSLFEDDELRAILKDHSLAPFAEDIQFNLLRAVSEMMRRIECRRLNIDP